VTGFAYFYRTYTATVSGSHERVERCAGCSSVFRYSIRRTVQGGGHSAFGLANAAAAVVADRRAREKLRQELDEAIEPVSCPVCGIFQPSMVDVLGKRIGRGYEPNEYALQRIAVPAEAAWRAACAANTVDSYKTFAKVWPTYDQLAETRLRELRHPMLRKLLSGVFYAVWGAVALAAVGMMALGLFGRYLGR
jgi:hypothetical protein